MQSVCVFCGSSLGRDPDFEVAARALGTELAKAGLRVVYGGGGRGLMGALADAAIEAGAHVTGVLPSNLFDVEPPRQGLDEFIEVDSMHQRKAAMYERADAFVGLPGGFGTLEEVAEVSTWSQLGLHAKPIVLLNLGGFFTPLLAWMDGAVDAGFIKPKNRRLVRCVASVDEVVPALASYGER